MKLTTRFSLSHTGMVVLTLLISFFFIYEGARLLYQRQARSNQEQQISDFVLAAKETLIQREDVAVLNFMKSVLRNPLVAYAVYSNPAAGIRIVLPQEFQKEKFSPQGSKSVEGDPFTVRRLSNGLEVGEWTAALPGPNGELARLWLGYSKPALDSDLASQTHKWLQLEMVAGTAALFLGLLVSLWLGLHLAAPLKKISEGTFLVREGKLGSLVQVSRRDEIGTLARDFNTMVIQLKELDEMKRDFVAGITHDFGTPLQAIRSAINYLQAGDAGPLTEKQSEYLLMLSNSTAHLTAFVNDLLTTARIEAAKVEPYYQPVDVLTYVWEFVQLYQAQAKDRGVKLTLVKKVPYISLMADVTMFRQIVLNLISNALKFTLKGEVDVMLSEEDGYFVLEVEDTGIGIDPLNHKLIFDKFFRVRQPDDFPVREGSGLGLSIAKGLVEAHGGKITVTSALGKGSSFKVVLPKQQPRY